MADLAILPGQVWLVGAGPGDPDLLTRKAEQLLGAASIVFHDALVSREILALIPPAVRQICVGKRSGRHSKSQDDINALLVAAALAGERVVRLKGGDPSIFGRSSEEMEALRAAGVNVRICPGITAASAAAASAGVSLTRRGAAQSIRFVTAHARSGAELDIDWRALAEPNSTLAIYMGAAAAPVIRRKLLDAGLPRDTPVLIAADASLPSERLLHTRLDLLALAVKTVVMGAPTLILIGAAVHPPGSSDGQGTPLFAIGNCVLL